LTDLSLYRLEEGIFLKSEEILIPWGVRFEDLKGLGNPEVQIQSEERKDFVWSQVHILGCLKVDLVVMRFNALFGTNKRFEEAFAYISESELEETRKELERELGVPGEFKTLNSLEYRIRWKTEGCRIELKQCERFGGNYWMITIKK
jgi:hypothetical protein